MFFYLFWNCRLQSKCSSFYLNIHIKHLLLKLSGFSTSVSLKAWVSYTNPLHQLPPSAGICTLQWFHMTAQPTCSKHPPAGSSGSPAPLLFAWPKPLGHYHMHPTCTGNEVQTCRYITNELINGTYNYPQSTHIESFIFVVLLWFWCCTCHRCVHTTGSAQQNLACWGGP